MEEKIHASQIIKFISSCKDGCELNNLREQFKESRFTNCSGNCYNLDELIEFMKSKGAIEIRNNLVVFKGCPSSGC